jgi:hypothetical protein
VQSAFRTGIIAGFLAAAQAGAGQAVPQQTPLPKIETPTGILSGTVYCADTNQPARLAEVHLLRISEKEWGTGSSGQTDLEGRFSFQHLAEGDYYVVAVLPGYVNLLSTLAKPHLDAMPAEERRNLLAQVPSVTIIADQPAQLAVRLERGAEIDGTVTYDDGSPAIGLRVSYKLKTPEKATEDRRSRFWEEQVYVQNGQPVTDDRGHFRILGVPPGEYLVHVTVPVQSSEEGERNQFAAMLEGPYNNLEVYAGGALRASKAETIQVSAGGAQKDADITIPLSKLHTIRGQVLLKSSNTAPVTANVELLYADTREEVRSVLAPNGKFEIFYVPEESFVLRAAAGSQAPPDLENFDSGNGPRRIFWFFPQVDEGSPELKLQVTGNVENVSIAVPDPDDKKGHKMEIDRGGGGTVGFGISDDPSESSGKPQ